MKWFHLLLFRKKRFTFIIYIFNRNLALKSDRIKYFIICHIFFTKTQVLGIFFMSCYVHYFSSSLCWDFFISNSRKNASTLYIREMFGRHQHTQRNHSHLVVEGITTFTISTDTCPVKITTMRKRLFYADCHFLLLSLCDIYKKSFCTESFSDQLSPLHSHIDAKFLKMSGWLNVEYICKLWTSWFKWFHCSMLMPAKYLIEKVYAIW